MRCSSKRAGTSIWRKLLLAKTSCYIDLNPSCNTAALCWSGRLLVQPHTLHYPWLPSEPLLRQFWAINWQRIRERTLQSHRLLHHFQFASWRGQQDGLNSSSTSCWSWLLLPHTIPPSLLNCILSPYSYSISWDSKPIKLSSEGVSCCFSKLEGLREASFWMTCFISLPSRWTTPERGGEPAQKWESDCSARARQERGRDKTNMGLFLLGTTSMLCWISQDLILKCAPYHGNVYLM